MSTSARIRELQNDLPMPLAQLLKRALKAESGIEQHNAAFYLAEATIKLGASVRIGRWLDQACKPGSDIAKRLEGLALPSLGHWCGFFRDLSQEIAKLPGAEADSLARGVKELGKSPKEWEAVQALAAAMIREEIASEAAAKQAHKRGVLGLFDLLVSYRNEVVGHGAQRTKKFYEEFGKLLLDAVACALAHEALFGDLKLAIAKLAIGATGRKSVVQWYELSGLGGSPLTGVPSADANGGELYFLADGVRVPLHPLVIYQEDDRGHERFGFLNKAITKKGETEVKRVDYLDYATGEGLDDVDAVSALGKLLGMLRGKAVDADAVAQTIAALARQPEPGLALAATESGPAHVEPTKPPEAPGVLAEQSLVLSKAEPGELIGQYRIIRQLGEGGMGTVYEVEHVSLERRYALKVLRPELAASDEMVFRFEREAKEAAATRHPGIVDVIDLGRSSRGVYLVMEMLDGKSAKELLDDGPLPIDRAVWLIAGALDALEAAHERKLIHRDIKPDNLFVARDERGERVKVLDFGIAKALEQSESMTTANAMLGTPVYMSPDQIKDSAKVDARADIYSMGATLYHLLTGERPITGSSVPFILTEVVQGHVERDPRKLRPEVPDWLAAIVIKAMAFERTDRFASAKEMQRALETQTSPAAAPLPVPDSSSAALASSSVQSKVTTTATGVITEIAGPIDPQLRGPGLLGRRGRPRSRAAWVALAALLTAGVTGIGKFFTTSSSSSSPDAVATRSDARVAEKTAATPAVTGASASAASVPAGMVRIEGAVFAMGSSDDEVKALTASCPPDSGMCRATMFEREKPLHHVRVSPFAIDAREVNNGELARWLAALPGLELREESVGGSKLLVAEQKGTWLAVVGSGTWSGLRKGDNGSLAIEPGLAERAAVSLSWIAARRYCQSRQQRLPTEAEWELAARGPKRRSYPWGDGAPGCESAIFGRAPDPAQRRDAKLKGAFPCIDSAPGPSNDPVPEFDKTPEGVSALGGNVREWVLDSFDESAPGYHPCEGPCVDPGRDAKEGAAFHVVRGGGFYDLPLFMRGARRSYHEENRFELSLGFRCALPLEKP